MTREFAGHLDLRFEREGNCTLTILIGLTNQQVA